MDATTNRIEETPQDTAARQRAKLLSGIVSMRPTTRELEIATLVAERVRVIAELVAADEARAGDGGEPLDVDKCVRMGLYVASFAARDQHRRELELAIEATTHAAAALAA